MIRIVLAVVLAVALLGIAGSALEHGSAVYSERQVQAEVAAIEEAATSLVETDEPSPAGQPGPRRSVTVVLPRESVTSQPVERLDVERVDDRSVIRYRVAGRPPRSVRVDAPIVGTTGDESVDLAERGTEYRLVLVLERDSSGATVVRIARPHI